MTSRWQPKWIVISIGLLAVVFSHECPRPGQAQPAGRDETNDRNHGRARNPINVNVFGNQLVVTSDDPQALRRVSELVRLLTSSQSDFEVIRLKHAKAAQAAKLLNEAFNGAKAANGGAKKEGNSTYPGGGFAGRDTAGRTMAAPQEERVRVVADPSTNSLMVLASPLDLLAIRSMVEKKLDAEVAQGNAAAKTHSRIPLKNMYATDAYFIVRDILREDTGDAGDGADGDSKGVAVSITYDQKTNSLIVACPASLYEDIKTLIEKIDVAAGNRKSALLYFQKDEGPPTLRSRVTIRDQEDIYSRPIAYRPGKLPDELPAWFTELDTNNDGQIAMHEWRKAGKSIAEFHEWDRNNDGFITPTEGLGKQRLLNKAAGIGAFDGYLDPGDMRDPKRGAPCRIYNARLMQGKTYLIDLRSRQFDSFLRLEDSSKRQLAQDDDGGGNLNARITFRCPRSGTYRVIATSVGGNAHGAYTLSIREK